jgi:allantoinase
VTRFDLVVTGAVVTPSGVLDPGSVGIADGRIHAVWQGARTVEAREHIDVGRCWVLPGAIDAHVHCFSSPQEGFLHATRAAAAGGVTTIIEMPYDDGAPVTSAEVLERKIERLQRAAVVDVALLGTLRKRGGLGEIERLARAGVCGFKLSLYETHPERFPRIEDDELLTAFKLIHDVDLTVGVHAENGALIDPLVARYREAGKVYPRAHGETRPPVSETASVALALELAAAEETRLHIYHASLPRTFSLVGTYRAQGLRASAETCPHYLVLDEDDMERLGGLGKINPPLRSAEARAGLWTRLESDVDMVTSDHAPWPLDRKSNRDDIFANASGAPGVETLLPLLFSEGVAAGRLSIGRLASLLAEGPARVFDLWPRKGQIAVGADADLAILDPSVSWTVEAANLQSSAGWTPYEGRQIRGRVTRTIVRGRTVYDGSTIAGEGLFVRPTS